MRSNPVVHVSNLKRYFLDQKDTRHKEVVQSHATKKSSTAKKVEEILIKKMRRIDKQRSGFQPMIDGERLPKEDIIWKHFKRLEANLILHH